MSLYTIGRICVKLAGRDAGQKCVVLSEIKNSRVLIDGATRRREVNVNHLEPLADTVEVKAGASTAEVSKVLEPFGVKLSETKAKKAGSRPKQVRLAKKTKRKSADKGKPAKKIKKEAKLVKEAVAPKKVEAPVAPKAEVKEEVKTEAKTE
tara:strand:+ start:507 stop:959 length:453 start_codon:yes stop_codon:yes gene_type:complete